MSQLIIRPGLSSEIDALNKVMWDAAWMNKRDRPFLEKSKHLIGVDTDLLATGQVRVALVGDDINGFCSFRLAFGGVVLVDLFTAPAFFGTGIGRALVGDVVAKQCAPTSLALFVDANLAAKGFYDRLGFGMADDLSDTSNGQWMKLDPRTKIT